MNEKQNDKQDAALIYGTDTIRGCMNNCISCYACKLADGIAKARFDTPVESKIAGSMDTKDKIEKVSNPSMNQDDVRDEVTVSDDAKKILFEMVDTSRL